MATPIDRMKSDYMTMEEITAKLRAEGVEEYLRIKRNGEYEYLECENCDGPMLGHQVEKCRHNGGYEEKTIVRFKKWLDKIPELRRLLEARAICMAERAAENQAEMMGFVSKSLRERIGDERTIERILTVMVEKFSGTIYEQKRDRMEKIHASKTDRTVDSPIDDETTLETAKSEIFTPRMEQVTSAQIEEELEASDKEKATEKLRPKDTLEEPDGKPKRGKTREFVKRELRGLKVVENRDEPFTTSSAKETFENYVTNDRRTRIDYWRSRIQFRGYRRSESRPGYFRTASKGRYIRDSSQLSEKSPLRPTSRPDGGGIGSLSRSKSPIKGTGKRDRSTNKPKSESVKKVEGPEKEKGDIKESIVREPR